MAFIDLAPPSDPPDYRVRVRDAFNNIVPSATVGDRARWHRHGGAYQSAVAADGANRHWRLGEGSGATGWDMATGNDLTLSGVTRNVGGAISGDADTASTFDGSATVPGTTTGWISACRHSPSRRGSRPRPRGGGKIIGLGAPAPPAAPPTTGRSTWTTAAGSASVRRRLQCSPAGPGTTTASGTTWSHHTGSSGIRLVLDGNQVGANSSIKTAGYHWGYWRVGGDQLSGRLSRPTNNVVRRHPRRGRGLPDRADRRAQPPTHNALGRGAGTNVAPSASFTASVSGSVANVDAFGVLGSGRVGGVVFVELG